MFNLIDAFNDNIRVGNFGIGYLDKKLGGISRSDLILIGSRSGAGKSSLANMIARANPETSVLFSLENFQYDDKITQAYYFYMQKTQDYSYSLRRFAMGDAFADKKINDKLKKEIEDYIERRFHKMTVIHRQPDFTVEKMKQKMLDAVLLYKKKILIIDHLDYVEKDSPNETDVSHISILMKTIRELQDRQQVAVVAISHLRKPLQQKEMSVIPSMDEFYGSSNKVKEATAVIMFAPDDATNSKNPDSVTKNTWCCIRKLRFGGIDNTAANLSYSIRKGEYEKYWSIFKVNYSGSKTEFLRMEDLRGQNV